MSRISSFFVIFLVFIAYTLKLVDIASCDDFWGIKTPKITFNENNGKYFEVYRSFKFGNDVLVHIIYPNDTDTYCIDPSMNFRLGYGVNGTITPYQIDFPFPAYNFCPGPNGLYSFSVTDLGKIISNSFLARVPTRNGTIYPNAKIRVHRSRNDGPTQFVFAHLETETQIVWINFELDNEMNSTQLSNGTYSLDNPTDQYNVYTGVDRN